MGTDERGLPAVQHGPQLAVHEEREAVQLLGRAAQAQRLGVVARQQRARQPRQAQRHVARQSVARPATRTRHCHRLRPRRADSPFHLVLLEHGHQPRQQVALVHQLKRNARQIYTCRLVG